MFKLLFSFGLLGLFFSCCHACVDFNGIGDRASDYYSVSDLSQMPQEGIYVHYLQSYLNEGLDPDSVTVLETSIQTRKLGYNIGILYSVAAMYEAIPLEFFGRTDISNDRRRCETSNSAQRSDANTDLFYLHRSAALIYAGYFDVYFQRSAALEYMNNLLSSYGLDPHICDEDKYPSSGCDDTSTPWGLAYAFASEMNDFSSSDGWNADGSYNRHYNKIPFSDYRDEEHRYIPKNRASYADKLEYPENWAPLLEHDDIGFVYDQRHVTPHVGYTGRSWYFSNDHMCERSEEFKQNVASKLKYDYESEIELLFERMAGLTDESKMEIEFFDRKFNLGDSLDQYSLEFDPDQSSALIGGYDSFGFLPVYMVYLTTVYEAVLAVWKEKVDADRVRPPSIIRNLLGDTEITTYAGVNADGESYGTQTYAANEFNAYIRTMPHSEYPSGSTCICSAWADAMTTYWSLKNASSVTDVLGENGFSVSFAAYSSTEEPLSTPSEDITLYYQEWSDLAKRCGETRLEGGMHFTASVTDAETLCSSGIGSTIARYVYDIENGRAPSYAVDPTDLNLRERDCYPEEETDKSGKGLSVNYVYEKNWYQQW